MGGKIIRKNQPCISCKSHDARQVYDKGDSFCFSCQKFFSKEEGEKFEMSGGFVPDVSTIVIKSKSKTSISFEEILELPNRPLKDRKITKEVCDFFGVKVSFNSDGNIDGHYYPYGREAYKVRKLPKEFFWVGKSQELFGQDKFGGDGKRIIITEGEVDALSIAQASIEKYGRIYPVVSVPSATGLRSLIEQREWLRTFKEIVICFDQDDAGKTATEEAIKILGIDKIKIAKLPHKDPNEVLVKEGGQRLLQSIFDASKYVPSGIISKEEIWDALVNYNSIPATPYPACVEGLNHKLKGMRSGEITLFISGTGSGKSTLLREIMLHIIATTDDKIGIVSLEESPAETARKLSGMALRKNPEHEEIPIEELQIGFDSVFGSDRIVLLDHQGSIDDNSIMDKLEYMCLIGCKFLFIDHITILVSEGMENLRGNEAQDKVMNDLLRLIKRHSVWIGLVSHLRKVQTGGKSFEEGKMPSLDDIRGSGSIKQISFDIVAFARNLTAVNEIEKNTIAFGILKARRTGLTGRIHSAIYNHQTGRLSASDHTIDEFVSIE
jgi:twinkle protein